jgi:hypothetical protein
MSHTVNRIRWKVSGKSSVKFVMLVHVAMELHHPAVTWFPVCDFPFIVHRKLNIKGSMFECL